MATKTRTVILDNDLVKLTLNVGNGKRTVTLFWGDEITLVRTTADAYHVRIPVRQDGKRVNATARLPKKSTRFREQRLLKVRFVDVGQGDGAIIETPQRRLLLVDGGEEDLFRRYFSTAFAHKGIPVHCAAMIMTHGDSDHFKGLLQLIGDPAGKKPVTQLITADRVFHNGLIRTGKEPIETTFGKTKKVGGKLYVVDLKDDVTKIPPKQLSEGFAGMARLLPKLRAKGGKLQIKRLEYGDDQEFAFLAGEGVHVRVFGPIVEKVQGKPALPVLHKPRSSSLSDSHTINGHSVILKMTYGNVRFLFGADLNEESEEQLVAKAREEGDSLESDILKVPHHGAEDFSVKMFEAVSPVVSVVSSGDENSAKDYIHPRAGLVGALGKYSRPTVERPLIYVTEMVAFFKRISSAVGPKGEKLKFPYDKTAFGIVHVRTDGERVLIATHSARDDRKESYAFRVDERGGITMEDVSKVASMKEA